MPIIYFEGIKPPCNSTDTQPLLLWEKERWVTISNSGFRLSHWTLPTYNFKLFNISHLLEVVVVRRKKVIGMVLNNTYYLQNTISSLRQYIGGTIVYFLNRHGGSNLEDEYLGFTWHHLFKKSIRCANTYIGWVRADRSSLTPLCLFIMTSPINWALARGNGNRFITQNVHIQIANSPRSPQSQTKAQWWSPSRPISFFVTIYL